MLSSSRSNSNVNRKSKRSKTYPFRVEIYQDTLTNNVDACIPWFFVLIGVAVFFYLLSLTFNVPEDRRLEEFRESADFLHLGFDPDTETDQQYRDRRELAKARQVLFGSNHRAICNQVAVSSLDSVSFALSNQSMYLTTCTFDNQSINLYPIHPTSDFIMHGRTPPYLDENLVKWVYNQSSEPLSSICGFITYMIQSRSNDTYCF